MYDLTIEQDISNAYYNLIFLFIFILILAFLLYISFVNSTKQPRSVSISKTDFDAFENQSKQPDLLFSNDENSNKTLDYNKLHEYAILEQCPKGKCILDTTTGAKRCPTNDDISLSYLPASQTCTNKFSCDYPLLPFALRPDNSAVDSNCGVSEPCRCLAKPQCASQVTATFDINNGSPYSSNSNELNYYFSINNDNQAFFNKNSLTIDKEENGARFCRINPAFTDRITNGCQFSGSIADPIDCSNANIYQLLKDNTSVNLIPKNYEVRASLIGTTETYEYQGYNTGDIEIFIYDTSNKIYEKEYNGFFQFSQGGEEYQIYYDQAYTSYYIQVATVNNKQNVFSGNQEVYKVVKLSGILSRKLNTSETIWNRGFPVTIDYSPETGDSVDPSGVVKMTPINVVYQPCQQDKITANYKNMLKCVQPEEQPCNFGSLTYNVDQILDTNSTVSVYDQENARNFCRAFDKTRLDATKAQKFYLNDPGAFTTSCMIGVGCGGAFDSNLCTDDSCQEAIDHRKNHFFSNYDDSAVQNYWILNNYGPVNFPGLSVLPGSANVPPSISIINKAMFNLEAGDYWQRNNPNIIKFLSQDVEKDATNIPLTNIESLKTNDPIQYPGYDIDNPITITGFDGNSINISSAIGVSLKKNSDIRVLDILGANDFGLISKNINNNNYFLMSINGVDKADISDFTKLLESGVVIYKQFGFNGINYNTVFNQNNKNREYSKSFFLNDFRGDNEKLPVFSYNGVVNETSTNQAQYSRQAFNDENVDFKNLKSMYYPVWNNSSFRQECVLCDPGFFAFTTVSDNNQINSAQIQFSAQQFFNYVYWQSQGRYVYSTFTKIVAANSNTNFLVMENINTNISIGDYIIDAPGFLERNFVSNSASTTAEIKLNLASVDWPNGYQSFSPPSSYEKFIIVDKLGNQNIITPANNITANYNGQNYFTNFNTPAKNYFMGKYYNDKQNNIYQIIPVVKVIDIIENNIITDANINLNYDEENNFFIQTIKEKEILELTIQQDIDNPNAATGSGATASIDEISRGRITNINIENNGNNYSIENKPSIYVSNYYSGEEINYLIQ